MNDNSRQETKSSSVWIFSFACMLVFLFTLLFAFPDIRDANGESHRDSVSNSPAFFERQCALRINLGNDGDEWMDALDECAALKQELKALQPEATASS